MAAHANYYVPESWDQAVSLLRKYGDDASVLAGGTDLMILLERGQIAPRHIISLDHIPGWDSMTVNGELALGAGTTYRQLERTLSRYGPHRALVEAARQVGGVQVRNVATVAGNFCNASPAADAVPPLLTMDAAMTLYGPQGERMVPADEFITGPRQTILGEAELLRQIHVPTLPQHTATVFLKAGRRNAMEISIVCVAVRLTLSPDGKVCRTARIALGAVAPTPIRATDAERLLEGQPMTREALEEAAHLAEQAADPISDVRASAQYRRHLTRIMALRGLQQCIQQLAGNAL